MSDLHDSAFDDLQQIGALIAAAQDIKNAKDYTYDAWEVNEPKLNGSGTSRQRKDMLSNEGATVTVRVEFKLRHKPQLRHVTKSEPRHCNSRLGKPEPRTALHAPNYPGAQHKKEEPTG